MGIYDFGIPDVFAVGHDGIDTQHREIAEVLRTYIAQTDSKMCGDFIQFMESVENLLISHFRDEELIMESVGYPGLLQHQFHHREYLTQVREVIDGSQVQATNAEQSMIEFFRILISDVAKADQGFARYLESFDQPRTE